MERSSKKKIINKIEFCIKLWKENQSMYQYDEVFFHHAQSIIDELESQLDILTRMVN